MRRLLACLLLLAGPAYAGETCSTEIDSCGGSGGGVSNGGVALTANTVPKANGASSLTDSTITDTGTIVTVNTTSVFGASVATDSTRNFLRITGTLPAVPTIAVDGAFISITGAGSAAFNQRALNVVLNAGYTGATNTLAGRIVNSSAGTNNDAFGGSGNLGVQGAAVGATATGHNIGGLFNSSGGVQNVGVRGAANTAAASTTNIGGLFIGRNTTGTAQIGVYSSLNANAPTYFSSALVSNNSDQAVPIAAFVDNSTALPTTAATASVTVTDGANLQIGNAVLTSATMTAETQALAKTVTSSYTWTNAQVVALGAALTGDITVATLSAKTQVVDALVVILTAAGGPTTLTVSCGDAIAGTPFINYVVASDAKAAANTVYGDAAAERGTSIDTEFFYLPSYTATTLVTCHFIATVTNLNTTTTSTGRVILTTRQLP